MSPQEYHELQAQNRDVILIDIREQYEFEHENIGAKHIPLGEVLHRLDEIPKDKTVIIHCQSGARAGKLIPVLQDLGFENVQNLDGGLEAYLQLLKDDNHE
jgi:rhodanese-related sulfurtransferase